MQHVTLKTRFKPHTHKGNLLRTRRALAQAVLDGMTWNRSPVLLFGLPGGGKSALLDSAARDVLKVSKGSRIDIVEISCNGLTARYPSASACLVELGRIRSEFMKDLRRFRIFVLDEVDAIGPARQPDSSQAALPLSCMDWIRSGDARVMLLLITNVPSHLDRAILNTMGPRLYLPCPDEIAAASVLRQSFLASDARAILLEIGSLDPDCVLNVRSLVKGVEILEKRGHISGKRLTGCNPKVAATHFLAVGGFHSKSVVDRYETDPANRDFIDESEWFMSANGI